MVFERGSPTIIVWGKRQRHLYIDEPADIADLPGLDKAAPGSDAYCLATQDVYILGSAGAWEVQ
ncbi:MAG: hypothetical protein LBJ84_05420 [Oscillospiraceae bacterium]|nr:hypothetical protein [Oscillospiraceae bacterium]